jgi:hypothetical protein
MARHDVCQPGVAGRVVKRVLALTSVLVLLARPLAARGADATEAAASPVAIELACSADGVPPGRGRLCVQLSIREGRPWVDPGGVFVANGLPASITRDRVLSTLQGLLATIKPRCDTAGGACLLPDTVLQDCIGDAGKVSPWSDFWARVAECGDPLSSVVGQVSGIFGDLGKESPFEQDGQGQFSDGFDSDLGVLQVQVVGLTAATPLRVIGPLAKGERETAVRHALAPLQDALWNSAAIVALINGYYQSLQLSPKRVSADRATASIDVIEAERLREVALPAMPDPTSAAQRRARLQALYQLLDDHDFRAWLSKRARGESAIESDSVEFVRDLGYTPCEEPFWIDSRMLKPKTALSTLGLSLQPTQVATRPGSDHCSEQPLVSAQVLASDEASKKAAPKPRFIGVELAYRPGQGTSVRGVYEQDMLALPQADLRGSVKAGREDNLTAGQFDLSADYIAFEQLQHRLSFTVTAVDAATPRRWLEGELRDERRHGRQAQLMFEPFRERDGQRLSLTTGLQRSTVTTRDDAGNASQLELSAWNLGADWHAEGLTRLLPWTARLQPSLTWGRVLGQDQSYRKAGLTGGLHMNLEEGRALDFSAHAEAVSQGTPVVEQPSLGGAQSVRGFREDDGIGARLWALQSELWLPLPAAGKGKLAEYVSKLRVAPFIDAGGVYRPAPGARAGPRQGAGLGLRLLLDPAVIKLDYAWRHGPSDSNGPRSRVHFSLSGDIEL